MCCAEGAIKVFKKRKGRSESRRLSAVCCAKGAIKVYPITP